MSEICHVPNCPAFARRGYITCALHEIAARANDLHIAKDSDGHGGKSCSTCKRRFQREDWVMKEPVLKPKSRTPGDPYGYQHVVCEPASRKLSRKQIRESEKPLLEIEGER